jgi:outer membrane protein OmpA-like peptidoglycan-associated protein
MKQMIVLPAILGILLATCTPVTGQSLADKLKQKIKDKASQTADDTKGDAQNAAEDPSSGGSKPASDATPAEAAPAPSDAAAAPTAAPPDASAAAAPLSISAYQNYDFTPGDSILFADDFTETQDGEFPAQWDLLKGQGVVNKQQGYEAMLLTDGNYVQISPRMTQKTYLGPQFTLEYDTFMAPDAYPTQAFLETGDNESPIAISANDASYTNGADSFSLSANLPGAINGDNFNGKWHHVAIAVKDKQLKIYVDQYRVLTVPDMHTQPDSMRMGGIGQQQAPLIFTNLRLASGGGMNIVGQKFTAAKIVTHGINFDIDKATLRPESMGTLNQIVSVLNTNPDLKFEIDGHTDNSGTPDHNLTLSQQRADAVKAQLVSMGVSASRLTTKGFGDTQPLNPNDTPANKANNRRVEFVKVG